jgi:hypothetical protein
MLTIIYPTIDSYSLLYFELMQASVAYKKNVQTKFEFQGPINIANTHLL